MNSEDSPSILAFVRSRLAEGAGLENVVLPDEQPDTGRVRFAAGAFDGIATHHVATGSDGPAETLTAAIRDSCASSTVALVEERACDDGLVGYIDAVLTDLRSVMPDPAALYEVARRLVSQSTRRGPVKLGIALLGLFPAEGHRDILLTLGQHEEFTLFVAVALDNGRAEADDDLWALAGSVEGWGRIHVVERLAQRTSRSDILDWILRKGFRNSVMDEYLAYIAASRGGLLDRLRESTVDDDLLIAAGDLLQALIAGRPAQDIYDYVDGADAARAFIDLLLARAADLRHLIAVASVRRFVSQVTPGRGWPAGWTDAVRERLARDCSTIIDRQFWAELAARDLQSADLTVFWRAERAYQILGRPTLGILLERLRHDPLEPAPWYHVLRQADTATIEDVLALAEDVLPLAVIASGPGNELGLGREYAAHQCLDFVVQDLGKWPGRGWTLVAAALSSPVIRNRNMAINALTAWPRETWPDEAVPALRTALLAEPTDKVRQRLVDILA